MYCILFSLTLIMAAYLIFISCYQFPSSVYAEENIENLISARKNGFTLMGCMLGFLAVYTADIKLTKFETRAVWWVQIIKVVGGLGAVLATLAALEDALDGHQAHLGFPVIDGGEGVELVLVELAVAEIDGVWYCINVTMYDSGCYADFYVQNLGGFG